MIYRGSCHCGQVCFEVEGELGTRCGLQLLDLLAQGALLWFVPREKLTLLTPEKSLTDYSFGAATIRHRFCKICGIHPLGEGSDPTGKRMAAINVRCLENVDFAALPVDHYDGRAL